MKFLRLHQPRNGRNKAVVDSYRDVIKLGGTIHQYNSAHACQLKASLSVLFWDLVLNKDINPDVAALPVQGTLLEYSLLALVLGFLLLLYNFVDASFYLIAAMHSINERNLFQQGQGVLQGAKVE